MNQQQMEKLIISDNYWSMAYLKREDLMQAASSDNSFFMLQIISRT